ncbi:hypothetical protein ABEG18_12925 [Alsobacter sp. KACC 23698]|uniref:Uncharacterized protein n=1 Tax=Alsobacter sp. KACC 23698 TaxID=3149229 RepID=A0AAU7JMK6_9HYPH
MIGLAALWELAKPFKTIIVGGLVAAALALVGWLWFERQISEAYEQGKRDRIAAEEQQTRADVAALNAQLAELKGKNALVVATYTQTREALAQAYEDLAHASARNDGVGCLDGGGVQRLNRLQLPRKPAGPGRVQPGAAR